MSLQPCTAHESLKTLLEVAGPKTPPMPPPGAPAPVAPPMLDLGMAVKSEVEDDDGDAGHQWTEEEWKAWENWDGYEEVKEEIEEIEEEGFGEEEYGHDAPHEPQEEPEEEIAQPVKRAKSTPKVPKAGKGKGDDSDGYGYGKDDSPGYVDKSWDDSPWKWSDRSWSGGWSWGWQNYGKRWSRDDWVGSASGSSGSMQSPRQKAPWAYGPKGKSKGKGKKGKQDKHGGVYVRGGYVAPDQTFYK